MDRKMHVCYTTLILTVVVFSLCFICGCGSSLDVPDPGPSVPVLKHAFYSEDYKSPHSQSPEKLSEFMTSQHLDYHLFGYNFCASLVDNEEKATAFCLGIEHNKKYEAGVGFRGADFGESYVWADLENSVITTTTNPWSVTLTSPDKPGSFISIQLISGLMGSANAVYRLTADISDSHGKRLRADVQLRDTFGAVNQGYGTTSFYPHYITEMQRAEIMSLPERTIEAYLAQTHDPMDYQGDYYYALPLMTVERFSLEYDNKTLKGSNGKSWLDYFVLTANAEYMLYTDNSRWTWIAMQFPETDTAINALDMVNNSGHLPIVRLFNNDGGNSMNGARKATQSWEIDKITVEPVPGGKKWTSPVSGITYDLEYHVLLESSTYPGDLHVTLEEGQEIDLGNEGKPDYQGLGEIEGTLGGKKVNGRCWMEAEAK